MAFLIILLINISNAKYTFDNIYTVAKIDIDRQPPQIELIKIENTNIDDKKYANQTHIITAQIKIIEKNILENNFKKDNIKILINQKEVIPQIYDIKEFEKGNEFIIYEIKLGKLKGKGKLEIKINEGTIKDNAININQEMIIDTNIQVNN